MGSRGKEEKHWGDSEDLWGARNRVLLSYVSKIARRAKLDPWFASMWRR